MIASFNQISLTNNLVSASGGILTVGPNTVVNTNQTGLFSPSILKSGFVATRGLFNEAFTAGNNQMMSRTSHTAKDNINQASIAFGNFVLDSSSPLNANSGQICASFEYPSGTYTQVLFNGQQTGVIQNGGMIISDPITLVTGIPNNEQFWIRSWFSSSGGIWYSNYGWASGGEGSNFGATTPNLVTGGGITPQSITFFPLAIIGPTTKTSVLLLGDSRLRGLYDSIDAQMAMGYSRVIDRYYGSCNCSQPGAYLSNFPTNHTNQLTLAPYATHIITNLGINDFLLGSSTFNQFMVNVNTFINAFSGNIPIYWQTIYPSATSSDNYTSYTGQSLTNGNSYRVQFNDYLRNYNFSGLAGYIEISDVVEPYRDAGIFIVNGTPNFYSTDGLHLNQTGYLLIRDACGNPFSEGKNFLPVVGGAVNGPVTFNNNSTFFSGISMIGNVTYSPILISGTQLLSNSSFYVFTGGSGIIWTLPALNSCTGRLYYLKNRGSVTITLSGNGTDKIYSNVSSSTFSINPGEAYTMINDGQYWTTN
jgi:hypothetical protein